MSVAAPSRAGAYCPHCRRQTQIDSQGRCMNLGCDQVVLAGQPLVVEAPTHSCGPGRGARFISPRVLREAYELYLAGLSLRSVAAAVLERTSYRNARSCANSLHAQWRLNGWPLRGRVDAVRAVSFKHGLARDRDHRLRLRRASGEIQGVQCAAIKTRYGKGRGERCQLAAMRGGEYCHNHEPRLRDQVREHLAEMRSRRTA